MQRLAECPVNFNWACEGTNQELTVDISFKSASLLSGEGIPSGSKKKKRQLSAVSMIIPCKSP